MAMMREVPVSTESIERFRPFARLEQLAALERTFTAARDRFRGRVVWHINSTPRGGGVAEMLHWLVGYLRGGGIDTRWLTIEGTPGFFQLTKRLHHALHGAEGDGGLLGDEERHLYESVAYDNAEEFLSVLQPSDIVYLHDPQTAGLLPVLRRAGARVIWRCHIGTDGRNEQTDRGWAFLAPYLEEISAAVFSREKFIPDFLRSRSVVVHPSIDVFSPKNQPMSSGVARAILAHTGLIRGTADAERSFRRVDGAPGRVDRTADLIATGAAPDERVPLVVQVSRWDPLKDPIGVMRGFVALMRSRHCVDAHLILAGPSVHAVKDDPEAAATFDEATAAWRALPAHERRRITLACLPMVDIEENAAIVNALQRHAAVVVQKSLEEGFGLTVTEAMWKGRSILASAVGGIREQIESGVHGLLLENPRDEKAFAELLGQLLGDPELAARLGANAERRVRDEFLPIHQLNTGLTLVLAIDGGRPIQEAVPLSLAP